MTQNNKSKRIKRVKQVLISLFFILILAVACDFKLYITAKLISADIKNNTQKKTDDDISKDVSNLKYEGHNYENGEIRKFPYPYSSMLSICSDIDDTILDDFKTYHQFLNTKQETPHGEGLGLDVGDSMWLYMGEKYLKSKNGIHRPNEVMTYYKGIDVNKENNAKEITNFIKGGWIDCIHTFGDFSAEDERGTLFTRKLAVSGWQTFKNIGFTPKVWINHGNKSNKQNFGAAEDSSFMSYQQGDNPESIYYHTDITVGNGIKYVWNSVNSNAFGQEYPLFEISLRDEKKIWGFYRYTNEISNGKLEWTWTPGKIYRQLTVSNLDGIVKNKQYSIVAQHFGASAPELFTKKNIQALKLLKQYQDDKKILVARTTRLLDYADVYRYVMYNKFEENGVTYINITGVNDPLFGKFNPKIDNLRGLTFYTYKSKDTNIVINGKILGEDEVRRNPADETGKESVSIKWYRPDYKDYTK